MLEHPGRAVGVLQIPGDQAQIDQQFGIFGIQLEGPFIGHQRLVQMAHALQRHAQHVKGLGIAAVQLDGLQRPFAGFGDIALAPYPEAALEGDIGTAAHLFGGELIDQDFQLVEGFDPGVNAGQGIHGLQCGGFGHRVPSRLNIGTIRTA